MPTPYKINAVPHSGWIEFGVRVLHNDTRWTGTVCDDAGRRMMIAWDNGDVTQCEVEYLIPAPD